MPRISQPMYIVQEWDWDIVSSICKEWGLSLGQVNVTCKKAHNGWRPLIPPDVESLGRAEIERQLQRRQTQRGSELPPERDESTGERGSYVRVWLTDAYMLAAMRIPTMDRNQSGLE